ncbi:hypothetical protein ACN47E_003739 [Coniothyrium glycines]
MTDRRPPSDASYPPSRHRGAQANDPPYPYDRLNNVLGAQRPGSAPRRRRPSRASSSTHEPSQPDTVSTVTNDQGRFRLARNTLKKQPRRGSHTESASSSQARGTESEERADSVGILPRLGQLREGKASTRPKRRGSSVVSSSEDPRTLRRRHTDDAVVNRLRTSHKHGLDQRRVDSFTTLPRSSVSSVPSDVAQPSAVSGGTNSTVTQQSYDDYKHSPEQARPHRRKTKMSREQNNPPPAKTDATQTGVFQFLQQDSTHEHLPSTVTSSSESSSASDQHDDEHSSDIDVTRGADSPTTSPASTRRSNSDAQHYQTHDFPHLKKPLYASSFVHGHEPEGEATEGGSEEEEEEEQEGSAEGSEEGSDEDIGSEEESEKEHARISADEVTAAPIPDQPQRKPLTPNVSSTSSYHNDSRAGRLKAQERELANHILKSPKPRKNFRFHAASPTDSYPTVPLYSPQAYTSASPTSSHATMANMHGWPSGVSFPAPLPIGNVPHQSPELKHAYPLAVQPPMGPPAVPAPHGMPPFSPRAGQPLLYQQQVLPPQATVAGYELLAEKLSGQPLDASSSSGRGMVVPMYRKFEHMNHRVLLHLQDEMSELEEELRHLDECIAQNSPRDESGEIYPASRRGDARFGGELHYKRRELLGRVFQKLGQYNQALTSFNELIKNLDPAQPDDIQAYRAWMDEHEPIDEAESLFLAREKDLVAVSQRRRCVSMEDRLGLDSTGQDQSTVVYLSLALVVPLLALAIVPSLFGRLLVIALIGAAELRMITCTPEVMGYLSLQEWKMAGSVYFGLMALLAGLVR